MTFFDNMFKNIQPVREITLDILADNIIIMLNGVNVNHKEVV